MRLLNSTLLTPLVIFFICLLWTAPLTLSGAPQLPREMGKVIEYLPIPNTKAAWLATQKGVFYSKNRLNPKGWRRRFSQKRFIDIAKTDVRSNYQYAKIRLSQAHPDKLVLIVNNGPGSPYRFVTPDLGRTWKTKSKAPASDKHESNFSSHPRFKIHFDLLLHLQAGVTPWSFDNYHSLVLIEYSPHKNLLFSAEVNPSPRYFQLDYQITPRLRLYAGRILVPFDESRPHMRFGGYFNTTHTTPPNVPVFLPDVWGDLGLGLRYQFYFNPSFSLYAYLYTVNGFQDNGADPLNETTLYPDFTSLSVPDNNTDKAIGFRVQAKVKRLVHAGLSLFTNRYTDDDSIPRRLVMVGLDSRVFIGWQTSVKLGYIYTKVDLSPESSFDYFARAGLYAELMKFFGPSWYASLQAGTLQPDDRITDAGDQTMVGARLGYRTKLWDISLQHRMDIKKTMDKTTYAYSALRLGVTL